MFYYSIPLWISINNKNPPLDILKLLVTTLRNQDKKVSFRRVDEYEELEKYSEFMKTCHNMNITAQTTGEHVSSLNMKSVIPNNTLANITKYRTKKKLQLLFVLLRTSLT